MSTTRDRLRTSLRAAELNREALDRLAEKAAGAENRVRFAREALDWETKAKKFRAELAALDPK